MFIALDQPSYSRSNGAQCARQLVYRVPLERLPTSRQQVYKHAAPPEQEPASIQPTLN
jgi:hypothetical protein